MRLIDGDRLEDVIEDECFNYSGESDFNVGIQNGLLIARDIVQEAPTIDAEPIRHGKWISHGSYFTCSVCDEEQFGIDTGRYYCQNCGAKMDGGEP